MTLRFTVLASGSRGNASLIQTDGFGILLDAGLSPKELSNRLAAVGHSLASVHAMLLTHTHSDHWNDGVFGWLLRKGLPLFCHPTHYAVLTRYARNFPRLLQAGLVRTYLGGEDLVLAPGLRCRPLPVRHDGGETFGFRLEGPFDLFGQASAIGYLSDLGTWDETLVDSLANVDLLALEFNHDFELEKSSNRPGFLIARVLGEEGHLSNEQAADMLRAVLKRSQPGRLQHVVQLHLSEDCNRPALARQAARAVLTELSYSVRIHTAQQHKPGRVLQLNPVWDHRQSS